MNAIWSDTGVPKWPLRYLSKFGLEIAPPIDRVAKCRGSELANA